MTHLAGPGAPRGMTSTGTLVWSDDVKFDLDVHSEKTVLVVFSGKWCPPCRAMEPVLEQLARERPDVKFLELDVDSARSTAERLLVRSVPSLFLYREGKLVGQRVGAQSRRALEGWLSR